MATIHFSKQNIADLTPGTTRIYVYDDKHAWFGLTVYPSGRKTFHVRTTLDGQTRRVAIERGTFPNMTIDLALKHGQQIIGAIAAGINPLSDRKRPRAEKVTVNDLLELYIASKRLKQSTIDDYHSSMRNSFGEYLDRPLAAITEEVIKQVNRKRGKKGSSAMRVMRALLNFARAEYKSTGLYRDNPVDILSEQKVWHRYGRKKTYLKADEIAPWFAAVEQLDQMHRDYLLFLLFTGVRADTEAAALDWERINWRARTFHLIDTKNGEDIELPLPDYIGKLLKKRIQTSGRVFPLVDEARGARARVFEMSGVGVTRHDLRRSFLTLGESLDISWLSVKRLANHKAQEHGVTEGYIVVDLERLRKASNMIEAEVLRRAGREISRGSDE